MNIRKWLYGNVVVVVRDSLWFIPAIISVILFMVVLTALTVVPGYLSYTYSWWWSLLYIISVVLFNISLGLLDMFSSWLTKIDIRRKAKG